MKNKAMRIASAVCALAMCAAMVPAAAFAEPTTQNGVTVDKTASDLDANGKTTVTLNVGAGQEITESDVVFVLDKSTSVDVRDAALDMLDELMKRAGENRIKVGVVVFNKTAQAQLPLTSLNQDNYKEIQQALMVEPKGGTNVYGGLKAGQKMLDADSSVSAQDKHLVLVTDGVTYLWGDGIAENNSDIFTVYSQQLQNQEETLNAGNDMMSEHHPDTAAYFQEFEDMATWMENHSVYGQDAEDYKHVYGAAQYAPDEPGKLADSTYENAGFKEGDYISGEDLTEHGCANDVAVYMAASLWQNITEEGYNTYAYASQNYAQDYPWGPTWIENLSDLGKNSVSGEVPADTTGMFDAVKSDILYTIQSGTVTDEIGSDFDLNDLSSFTLTVGGEALDGSVDGNTVTFADGDYVVTYQPATDTKEEQFTWDIKVPVEAAAPLALSYDLQLVNKDTTAGTHYTKTNTEATLEYKPTVGGDPQTVPFPVPEVSYTVDPLAPEAPDYPTLVDLLGGINTVCVTNSSHPSQSNGLIDGSYTVTVDASKADGLGNGAVATVTVTGDRYARVYNIMNPDTTHTLAADKPASQSVNLVYQDNAWKLAADATMPLTFYVECKPVTTTTTSTASPAPTATATPAPTATATPAATNTIPQTSDDLPLGALIVVAIVAAGAVGGLTVLRKRREQ